MGRDRQYRIVETEGGNRSILPITPNVVYDVEIEGDPVQREVIVDSSQASFRTLDGLLKTDGLDFDTISSSIMTDETPTKDNRKRV